MNLKCDDPTKIDRPSPAPFPPHTADGLPRNAPESFAVDPRTTRCDPDRPVETFSVGECTRQGRHRRRSPPSPGECLAPEAHPTHEQPHKVNIQKIVDNRTVFSDISLVVFLFGPGTRNGKIRETPGRRVVDLRFPDSFSGAALPLPASDGSERGALGLPHRGMPRTSIYPERRPDRKDPSSPCSCRRG